MNKYWYSNEVIKHAASEAYRWQVMEEWGGDYSEEFHNFLPSPDVVRMLKLSTKQWVGHVARLRQMINSYKDFCWEVEKNWPRGTLSHRRQIPNYFRHLQQHSGGLGSSVGMATGYWRDGPGIEFRCG
jgi:hypothetical protein